MFLLSSVFHKYRTFINICLWPLLWNNLECNKTLSTSNHIVQMHLLTIDWMLAWSACALPTSSHSICPKFKKKREKNNIHLDFFFLWCVSDNNSICFHVGGGVPKVLYLCRTTKTSHSIYVFIYTYLLSPTSLPIFCVHIGELNWIWMSL